MLGVKYRFWTCLPFSRTFRSSAFPSSKKEDVLAPPGTNLRSFETLAPHQDYRGQTSDAHLEVTDAARMSMHIFDALGIPRDLFVEASGELVTLSNFNFIAVTER